MIVMLMVLTVGWVVMSVRSALDHSSWAPLYWTLLSVGATFFVLITVGVVLYLTLSIKAINLSRRQSNFIDSVTHELKSPIASLKLYLQTLTRHQPSPEERQEFYQSMLDDVDRLDQLINHVLDAARLEKSHSDQKQQPVRLDQLLQHCAEEVCQRRRVPSTTIALQPRACTVTGWPLDLELIFRNLLDNAVKYAGHPPEVSISLQPDVAPGRVRVRVSDNGRGIPHKFRQKVFGRFVRLGTELEREQPGLGLGLYIVRTLVAQLRGRVRVRSRGDMAGTIFEVVLPGSCESTAMTTSALD
jgi:signal transduction histidine kinase